MSLILDEISHRFGAGDIVSNVTLKAVDGEIVCLFGPSGCGKTTLLRIAAGLEPLQRGTVSVDGAVVATPGRETSPDKRPIGFVFQDYVLFPHMTVAQNVAFGIEEGGRAREAIIREELAGVGLQGFEDRHPHELSGGQQQRVALARALARRPRALLLDEPFASIDTVLRRRLREELRRILRAREAAVVMVTHDPEEALALGDRVALMEAGRIVETASPETLYRAPRTIEGASLFPDSQTVGGVIRDGGIETAFGRFPAPDHRNGSGAVVFRRGALRATLDEAGALRVAESRFSGPDWTVYLKGGVEDLLLRVEMAAPPRAGAPVSLEADATRYFVFPTP